MSFDADLIRSVAEPVVLSLVAEQARYGYEIIKVVNLRTDNAFQWKEGTLYPVLHRLEGNGLIKGIWKDGDNGKPRKYYTITAKGKKLLAEKRSEWSAFTGAVDALLFFGGHAAS